MSGFTSGDNGLGILDEEDELYYGEAFRAWLDDLETNVIIGEFGYEDGEFTVYANDWFPLYQSGLTPRAAWQRALDGFAEQRREEEAARQARWQHIQAEDAKLRAQSPAPILSDRRG